MTNRPNNVQKTKIPVKVAFSPESPAFSPILAASLFPNPEAAKNKPIIKAAYFSGANLKIDQFSSCGLPLVQIGSDLILDGKKVRGKVINIKKLYN